ncbi:MFS transporter [Aestuariispira insulae]|uniref:MFS transporter n=1 Tax=Aestuariispira insulae TaxID=1461337 RepID=A0A3D9HUY7_9PROT|nr:MFS transporter [Aestuariispira insulae]RED53235.1 MFS transporter [Aestuariispira insulae]
MRRFVASLLVLSLALATLSLYLYVSHTEAKRTYLPLRVERISQLTQLVRQSVEDYARQGLDLDQYSGFEKDVRTILFADPAVSQAQLVDTAGNRIYCFDQTASSCENNNFINNELTKNPESSHKDYSSLNVPVHGQFSQVGFIQLQLDAPQLETVITEQFRSVLIWSGLFFVIFGVFTVILEFREGRRASRLIRNGFFVFQGAIILVLTVHLFQVYLEGKSGQAKELAITMSHRLDLLADLGISIDSVSGIEDILQEYRQVNPDISAISLISNGKILHSAGSGAPGTVFQENATAYAMREPVRLLGFDDAQLVSELSFTSLFSAVWQGARGMLTLLFGCTLLGGALMGAAHAYRMRSATLPPHQDAHSRMEIIQPAYLMSLLVDAMIWPILPDASQSLAQAEGLSSYWAQAPFTGYFIALTFALIPAGRLIHKRGDRFVFEIGAICVASGLALTAFSGEFWLFCVGRMITGFGQGLLLVTIQDIALRTLPAEEKTQAASIQVLGYTAGVITGTGLGGLLASFHPYQETMLVAAIASGAVLFYTLIAVKTPQTDFMKVTGAELEIGNKPELGIILKDRQFLWILMTVGVVSKFALTGIVMFALPFLMIEAGYGPDTVGQALMFYSVIVYGSTKLAPRLDKSLGGSRALISCGLVCLLLGASGLMLAVQHPGSMPEDFLLAEFGTQMRGAIDPWFNEPAQVATIVLSIILLGVGQGLTASPALAAISSTRAALNAGHTHTLAVYRVLERVGHMSGPALVGIMLAASGGSAAGLLPVCLVFLVAAGLYRLAARESDPET